MTDWGDLWTVLGVVAASYRLTRLVTCDSLPPVRRLRCWIVSRGPAWLGDLVTCPWCAGVWVSGPIVLVTDALTSVPVPVWTWLLAAWVAGYVGQRDDCEDCP
jgi:hypothetical protein